MAQEDVKRGLLMLSGLVRKLSFNWGAWLRCMAGPGEFVIPEILWSVSIDR